MVGELNEKAGKKWLLPTQRLRPCIECKSRGKRIFKKDIFSQIRDFASNIHISDRLKEHKNCITNGGKGKIVFDLTVIA